MLHRRRNIAANRFAPPRRRGRDRRQQTRVMELLVSSHGGKMHRPLPSYGIRSPFITVIYPFRQKLPSCHHAAAAPSLRAYSRLLPSTTIPPLSSSSSKGAVDRDGASPALCSTMAACKTTAVDASVQPLRSRVLPSLSALKAGMPGAAAAACQAASFMWLSTTAAFQYRSGFTTLQALRTLYAQGGVARFYSGVLPTVLHITLCRFGDTTANNVALTLAPFDSLPLNTLCASFAGGAWRASLLPLETLRSNMQVRGPAGFMLVLDRFRSSGFRGLYRGSAASFSAGVVGHFPFFFTVNVVSQAVPLTEDASILAKIGRNGGMGFLAAMSADVFTNGFKVVATNKQTCDKGLSYYEVARKIMRRDGVFSIVTRGLKTRLLANGLQGATFVLLWKEIESRMVRTRFNSSSPP